MHYPFLTPKLNLTNHLLLSKVLIRTHMHQNLFFPRLEKNPKQSSILSLLITLELYMSDMAFLGDLNLVGRDNRICVEGWADSTITKTEHQTLNISL